MKIMFQEKTINALKWIVEILNKKNIIYQISGGFSAKLYGSIRSLNDIDIDISENKFGNIINEVKPYIIFGPQRFNDGKWDAYLMTLNFNGQEIDICGAIDTKVSNKERNQWISIPVDFSKVKKIKVEGISVNIISPEELIQYKRYLDGEHQVEDIKAVENYLQNER
mgnify:CR=1 FL=1